MTKTRAREPAHPQAYELKVTLRGIRPPIWRRFRVRDDITLGKLHDLLQVIMGWTDSHLHQFVSKGIYYGQPDPEFPRQDEGKVHLRDVLRKPKDRLMYEYDFGDSWDHDLVLERVLPHEARARYPLIVAGKRACPPEDCGGIPGYYRLLEALANSADPEHQELLEWVGGSFDPEAFDVGTLNRVFHGGWYLAEGEGRLRTIRPSGRAGRGTPGREGSARRK